MKPTLLPLAMSLLTLIGCAGPKSDSSEPVVPAKEGPTAASNASFAFVADSKENMGCLVDQKLVGNVLPELARGVALTSGTGAEDSAVVRELYFGFEAAEKVGYPVLLGFRISVESSGTPDPGQATIRNPRLEWGESQAKLTLRASGKGNLRIQALWTDSTEPESFWRTCPEADIREPLQGNFLAAANIEPPLRPDGPYSLSEGPKNFEFRFEKDVWSQVVRGAKSMAALSALAKVFGTAESRWVWNEAKIDSRNLSAAIPSALSYDAFVDISIKFDSGKELAVPQGNFAPIVKFRVSILSTTGKRVGAEVSIAIEDLPQDDPSRDSQVQKN